ncbi:von Willebrand factor type A domain-containing protein [Xylaria digitata]|nr:von Willebrand factor type A domain-containing protein [Xylaria digitata]
MTEGAFIPGIWWSSRDSPGTGLLDPREPLPPNSDRNPSLQGCDFYARNLRHQNDDSETTEPKSVLRPLSVSVTGRILHNSATISTLHVFYNKTDAAIQHSSYYFLLPAGWMVVKFECRIGCQKIMRARVETEREAQNFFYDATASGETAGLLKQITRNIFGAKFGNIPARTKVKVDLTFITQLEITEDNYAKLVVPMFLAPRQTSLPSRKGECSGFTGLPQRLSIEIQLEAGQENLKVNSPSHEIRVERLCRPRNATSWYALVDANSQENSETSVVTWQGGPDCLDGDFVLEIENKKVDIIQAWKETHDSINPEQQALMVTFPPMVPRENTCSMSNGELIFVTDCSGSMADKMEILISMMRFLLKGVPLGWKFNVWRFGSRQDRLWSHSHDYSSQSLETALAYVQAALRPDLEGSDLLSALTEILSTRDPLGRTEIILITDGKLWHMDKIIHYLRRTRIDDNRVRFFALGLGADVAGRDIERIATSGGGYADIVRTATQLSREDTAVHMMRAALSQHIDLEDIEFTSSSGTRYRGNDESIPWKIRRSPENLSTLGSFSRCQVFMLLNTSHSNETIETLHVVYRQNEKRVEAIPVPIEAFEGDGRLIHMFAASAVVQDLEDAYDETTWLTDIPWLEQRDRLYALKTEAENISCKWSLVSRWTNLFLKKSDGGSRISGGTAVETNGIHYVGMGLLRERRQPQRTTRTISYATHQLLTEGEQDILAYDNITERDSVEESEWNGFEDLPIGIVAPRSITPQASTQAEDRSEAGSLGVSKEHRQTINRPNTSKRNLSSIENGWGDLSESLVGAGHYTGGRKRARSSSNENLGGNHTLPARAPAYRSNEYFVPRDGIDREVITADIQRYLGPGASIKPGTYINPNTEQAIQGYFIIAYRNLTTAMIEDLKADSARWDQERRQKLQNASAEPPYFAIGANLRNGRGNEYPAAISHYANTTPYAAGYAAGQNRNSCSQQEYVVSFARAPHHNSPPRGALVRPIAVSRSPAPDENQRQRLLPPSKPLLDHLHSLSISEVVRQEDMIEDGTQQSKKEAVRKLLSAQNYDGSFSPHLADEIGGVPAELLRKAVTEFSNAHGLPGTAAEGPLIGWTVIIIAWLERDFKDCERLWQLMRMKAHAYLRRSAYWNIDEEKKTWTMTRGLLPAIITLPVEDPIAALYDVYPV